MLFCHNDDNILHKSNDTINIVNCGENTTKDLNEMKI